MISGDPGATQPAAYKPITLLNIVRWARRTAAADRAQYHHEPRPVTFGRLCRALWPSLRRPIFVIGAPRSGTTFLGRCLSELPELSYHFEPLVTKAATRYVYLGEWDDRWACFFYRMVYRWLMRIHLDGDLRFAEKTPRNCWIVRFLRNSFPDAQFVHIVRDGRDVAVSLLQKPWVRRPYGRFWVPADSRAAYEAASDLERCIWAWRAFTEQAITDTEGLPSTQYHELRYEALATVPRETMEPLLDFLGIDDPASRGRAIDASRDARPDSIGRWRQLDTDAVAAMRATAEPLLRRLGYVHDADSPVDSASQPCDH